LSIFAARAVVDWKIQVDQAKGRRVEVKAGIGSTYFFWGGTDDLCVVFNGRDTAEGDVWDSRHIFAVDADKRTYLGSVFSRDNRNNRDDRGIVSFKLPSASGGRLEVWESCNGEVRRTFDVVLASPSQHQSGSGHIVSAKLDLFLRQPGGSPGFHVSLIPSWNAFGDQTIRQLEYYHQQSGQLLVETVIGSAEWVESPDEPPVLWVFPSHSHFSGKRYIAHIRPSRVTSESSENIVTAFQKIIFSEGNEVAAVDLLFEGPLENDLPWYDSIVVFTISHFHERASGFSETDHEVFGAFRDHVIQDLSEKLENVENAEPVPDVVLNQVRRLSTLDILDNLPFLQRSDELIAAGSCAYSHASFTLPWLAPGDRFGIIVRRPIQIHAHANTGPEQNTFPDAAVFRYLVRGSVLEELTAENLARDPWLLDLLNRGASLLSSSGGEVALSEYSQQRRLSPEARAEYVTALGLDNSGTHPVHQRVASARAVQLHELLANRLAAPLSLNLLDIFLRSPGLFRFARPNKDWRNTLSRTSDPAAAQDGLFQAIWKLALPGAPPPDDAWSEPDATIRFLYFAQDNDAVAKCKASKLFPTVGAVETRQVRRLLEMAQSPAWRNELEGVAGQVAELRKLGNEWQPLKLIETAATLLQDRKSADEQSTARAKEILARYGRHDAKQGSAGDEPLGTREELLAELKDKFLAGLPEADRQDAADLIEASNDAALEKLVGYIRASRQEQDWPERAVRIISELETWGGAPEFSKSYSPSSPAPAAVTQFAAFNLQKWPREASGQLALWKRELAGQLKKNLTDDPGGMMRIESLVTYAEALLYRRVARSIDETLKAFTAFPSGLPPEIARGASTIRTLRQAFPYGANAAVIRLNDLLQEMESNGNVELFRLARTNRLKITMPRFTRNASASAQSS
jgi:hypothetical protein